MIDLRSETIASPSKKMLEFMFKAKVGDDVYGEDPTVKELENRIAHYFGMEKAMFFPSGTMANQTAIKIHTNPGDQVITHKYSHVYNYEGGGGSFNSGVSFKLLDGEKGMFEPKQLNEAINPKEFYHAAKTSLVCLENTTNKGGGFCWDVSKFDSIKKITKENELGLHMDGARIWNSIVARNDNPRLYGQFFDTMSVCLSKGLGCPIGSVLVGSDYFLKRALRIRKIFGGAMRQVGYLAAAGIYALENNINRLNNDHTRAKELSELFLKKDFVNEVNDVETNIIIINLKNHSDKIKLVEYFSKRNVLFDWYSMGPKKIRIVTHLNYDNKKHKSLLKIVDNCTI